MSYTKVYGLKFGRQELLEILPEKYKKQACRKWAKAKLSYVVGEFLRDVQGKNPKYLLGLFRTGWYDLPGDECVLGIQISFYQSPNKSPGNNPNNFVDLATYMSHTYGFAIHELKNRKISHQKEYDQMIDQMKRLIDCNWLRNVKPSIYRVENC